MLGSLRKYKSQVSQTVRDFCHNIFHSKDASIIVLRDINYQGNNHFFRWIKKEYPNHYRKIKFGCPGYYQPSFSDCKLLVQLLPDDYHLTHPRCYAKAAKNDEFCNRHGIPITTPVVNLKSTGKCESSHLVNKAGVHMARIVRVTRDLAFDQVVDLVGNKFIIRDNFEHGQDSYHLLVSDISHYSSIDWNSLSDAIAIEFIDVKNEDGLYRKYRYLMIGDYGSTRSVMISKKWFTHESVIERSNKLIEEELKVLNLRENPFHLQFNKARKALGLEYVGFDYGIDGNGELVIWEANAIPCVWPSFNVDSYFNYQLPAIYRFYEMMLKFYLEKT
ncbi:MAG: hypothetical protein RJQ09_02980 [Cyclobacteriaceae bacterium]